MNSKSGAPGRRRLPGKKRSKLVSLRLDETTMAALQSAADRSQLTLSSEVADRLIRSLSNDYGIPLEFEHSENRGFSGMIVTWERRLRQQTGRSWADDAYTFRAFAAGIVELLQLLPGRLGIADGEPVVPLRLRQIYSAAARPAAASAPDPRTGEVAVPLTKKGATILAAMTRQNNGDRKAAEREFYASINSGRIKGAEAAPSRPRPTKK